ncbi:hypothetical protein AB5I41_16840 [Sphingomonas sp. MMS24-JH45]
MTRRPPSTRWVTIVIPLLAAACSGRRRGEYNRVEVPEREAEAQNAIDAAVAANGATTTARAGVPVAQEVRAAARARTLPKDFQGYRGRTANDCELANTAATGRIEVQTDAIRFYESKARVTSVSVTGDYAAHRGLALQRGGGDGGARRRLPTGERRHHARA